MLSLRDIYLKAIRQSWSWKSEVGNDKIRGWQRYQGFAPGPDLLRQIEALRQLYLLDERAHFDWLLSDIAIDEIVSIEDLTKRRQHWNLLDRLLEHRDIVLEESGLVFPANRPRVLAKSIFPDLAERHLADALQYAEALILESDYFVTNDVAFCKVANQA